MNATPYDRGYLACWQDRCEGAPFGSTGGLSARDALAAPDYIPEADREQYLAGYEAAAESLYGPEWRTVKFVWAPAIVIEPDK